MQPVLNSVKNLIELELAIQPEQRILGFMLSPLDIQILDSTGIEEYQKVSIVQALNSDQLKKFLSNILRVLSINDSSLRVRVEFFKIGNCTDLNFSVVVSSSEALDSFKKSVITAFFKAVAPYIKYILDRDPLSFCDYLILKKNHIRKVCPYINMKKGRFFNDWIFAGVVEDKNCQLSGARKRIVYIGEIGIGFPYKHKQDALYSSFDIHISLERDLSVFSYVIDVFDKTGMERIAKIDYLFKEVLAKGSPEYDVDIKSHRFLKDGGSIILEIATELSDDIEDIYSNAFLKELSYAIKERNEIEIKQFLDYLLTPIYIALRHKKISLQEIRRLKR